MIFYVHGFIRVGMRTLLRLRVGFRVSVLGVLACLSTTLSPPSGAAELVRHINPVTDSDKYMVGLLRLALSYSDKKFDLEAEQENISRGRAKTYVSEGRLNLMWGGTSKEMESEFAPVRIPAYKGLLGHRIFIIHQGNQPRFDQITTLDALKQLSFGQGRTWSDTKILESAGFTIVKATATDNLLYMTDGDRFDAFPRGVHEPWGELKRIDGLDLRVEENIMLVYKLAYYFFLNKNNTGLLREIEQGLEAAIADGSFERYFYGSPQVQGAISKANIAQRRAFYIDNPTLPKNTPVDRAELWLNLEDLKTRGMQDQD